MRRKVEVFDQRYVRWSRKRDVRELLNFRSCRWKRKWRTKDVCEIRGKSSRNLKNDVWGLWRTPGILYSLLSLWIDFMTQRWIECLRTTRWNTHSKQKQEHIWGECRHKSTQIHFLIATGGIRLCFLVLYIWSMVCGMYSMTVRPRGRCFVKVQNEDEMTVPTILGWAVQGIQDYWAACVFWVSLLCTGERGIWYHDKGLRWECLGRGFLIRLLEEFATRG